MISSRIGTIMSRPSIENRVLPGNVRCRKRSKVSIWVMRSSSSRPSIGSLGGRNWRDFNRLPQPHPLVGHEHVVVVVPGGRAIDVAQLADRFERVRGALCRGARHDRRRQPLERFVGQAVRLRLQRRIADRIVKAERVEMRRKMAEAPDRLGEIERGDAGSATDRGVGASRCDRCNGCAGSVGVQVANARRVASSTDEGSRW